jgi:hypothetical protein
MKKLSLTVLVSLCAVAGAYAQTQGGVTMSTDPAKAADVEARAQQLQAAQSAMPQPGAAQPKRKHQGTMHHKPKAPAPASQ